MDEKEDEKPFLMQDLSSGCVPVTGLAHKLVGKFVGKIHFLEIWKKMKNPQPL